MGKLSLYKSRRYLQRKQRNSRSGRPSKNRKFPRKNKDIDSTLSYSDNVDNESGHAFNFYCGADPPCDSLLAAHITSENSSSPSSSSSHLLQILCHHRAVILEVPVRRKWAIPTMRIMSGTVYMSGTV